MRGNRLCRKTNRDILGGRAIVQAHRIFVAVLPAFTTALLLLAGPRSSAADTYYWSVAEGDWSVPENWGGAVPSISESAFIGNGGTATISQSGEVCNGLSLGGYGAASGTLTMVSGSLTTHYSTIGNGSEGVLNNTGGTHTITYDLTVGALSSTGVGTYNLSGSAQLSVGAHLYIGSLNGGVGLVRQSGGTNTTNFLSIGTGNRYELTAGALQINSGLQNNGTIDCGNGSGSINVGANCLVNLSKGTVLNANTTSLAIGNNSLLIVAPGFDPASTFASYTNAGRTHVKGSTLTVAAGQSIEGGGDIDDFVACEGSIQAPTYQSINQS